MNDQPKTVLARQRYEVQEMALRRNALAKSEPMQAEVIASHYLAHVNLARDLMELVEHRKITGPNADIDGHIGYCVGLIQTNHRMHFGIELTWKELE
jgi:hypothetical protein